MKALQKYRDPVLAKLLLEKVRELASRASRLLGRPPLLMEVCGTHTEAFSRTGLRDLLRGSLTLRSGPGCPVCVTAQEDIDSIIALSLKAGITLATFGDMMRVPGSSYTLEEGRARGASVIILPSPMDAVTLAERDPKTEVVFFGIGFETTAPVTALSIEHARRRGVKNFSVFSAHKLLPPALRRLLKERDTALDGLLLPGHVSAVTGRGVFDFISQKYRLPAVVTGFEAVDLLDSLYNLLEMLISGKPRVLNGYTRLVREEGNQAAKEMMDHIFEPSAASWRGFGSIDGSGLGVRPAYEVYDAAARFALEAAPPPPVQGCRCGELLRGLIDPPACPLFADACTPQHPAGPCMVSLEGACAAYYRYERRHCS